MRSSKMSRMLHVRKGYAEVFATFPDAQWSGARHIISGNHHLVRRVIGVICSFGLITCRERPVSAI